jgi:hypothetical protein
MAAAELLLMAPGLVWVVLVIKGEWVQRPPVMFDEKSGRWRAAPRLSRRR